MCKFIIFSFPLSDNNTSQSSLFVINRFSVNTAGPATSLSIAKLLSQLNLSDHKQLLLHPIYLRSRGVFF